MKNAQEIHIKTTVTKARKFATEMVIFKGRYDHG